MTQPATFTVKTNCDTTKNFASLSEAQDGMETHQDLCDECGHGDCTIVESVESDNTQESEEPAELDVVADGSTTDTPMRRMFARSVVDHFGGKKSPYVTEIDHGSNTSLDLNKDGTQLVANILDLEVHSECEVAAYDTDFEYCRYRAVAITPDEKEFEAVGDAHIDESGKSKWDLERLAEPVPGSVP